MPCFFLAACHAMRECQRMLYQQPVQRDQQCCCTLRNAWRTTVTMMTRLPPRERRWPRHSINNFESDKGNYKVEKAPRRRSLPISRMTGACPQPTPGFPKTKSEPKIPGPFPNEKKFRSPRRSAIHLPLHRNNNNNNPENTRVNPTVPSLATLLAAERIHHHPGSSSSSSP